MDAKALAKSKRAHSQHQTKKSYSSQKPRAPSLGANEAGSSKKQLGKQLRESTHDYRDTSSLPSNWDRYEDEVCSGSEDLSSENANQASDVIFPKSKGADYSHLIAEAQSQTQSYRNMDNVPSLDDVLPGDLNWGVGSMVAARGESILSWIGDDSFVVEENTTATPEVSFLSLNLYALAEQLAKIDLPERLFIEADLLPPELCGEESAISNWASNEMQTFNSGEVSRISGEASVRHLSEKVNVEDQNTNPTPVHSSDSGFPGPLLKSPSIPANDSVLLGRPSRTKSVESEAELNMGYIGNPNKKPPTYESAGAEAELDMLLSSFHEINEPDSSSASSTSHQHKEISLSSSQIPGNAPVSSKVVSVSTNFDDTLDDLLEETSNLLPHKEKAVHIDTQSSSSSSVIKSKALDDFDSWLDTI